MMATLYKMMDVQKAVQFNMILFVRQMLLYPKEAHAIILELLK